MIPDSREAALRAVPLLCLTCKASVPPRAFHVCEQPLLAPDYPALATAMQKWMRNQFPSASAINVAKPETVWSGQGYNAALDDVAKALGL